MDRGGGTLPAAGRARWIEGLRSIPAVCLTVFALGLAACTSGRVAVSSQPPGEGQGATAPSFAQFTDLPIPPGAVMDLSKTLIFGKDDRWTGRLVLETDESPDSVYEFYQREMPRFQWREITALRSETSLITMARMDRVATVTIESSGFSGSAVTVTVGPLSPAEPAQ